MSRIMKRSILYLSFLAVLMAPAATVVGQPEGLIDSVCITGVEIVGFDSSGSETTADIRVSWRVMRGDEEGELSSFDNYAAFVSTDRTFPNQNTRAIRDLTSNEAVFSGLDPYRTQFFRIGAYRENDMVLESEPFEFRLQSRKPTGWGPFFAWPLLALLDATAQPDALEAPRKATKIGWVAFELIGVFFLVGLIIWFFKALVRLRSTHIFMVHRKVGQLSEVDRALDLASEMNMGELDELRTVIDKTLTRKCFHGTIVNKLDFLRFWERAATKRLSSDREFHLLPSVRILKSAIAALINNKQDLEASLEARISAEEEELRKLGFIDVLWALGVTAPLVGLFGTVTGITESFNIIAVTAAQETNLMNRLAEGINEALFTTICGLVVGILFMLAYYYYQYKLERAHALWVMFAARFIDHFKHGQPDTQMFLGTDREQGD